MRAAGVSHGAAGSDLGPERPSCGGALRVIGAAHLPVRVPDSCGIFRLRGGASRAPILPGISAGRRAGIRSEENPK